jgi:hypothetical protein
VDIKENGEGKKVKEKVKIRGLRIQGKETTKI